MGKIYSKQIESINLQIFVSVTFSQDANPSLVTHNPRKTTFFLVDVSIEPCEVGGYSVYIPITITMTNHIYKTNNDN